MSNDVKIITDSAADLSDDMASSAGITVVPLSIRFDDVEFIDGVELTKEQFWDRMAQTSELPATAAPSPGAFQAAFEKAAADGFRSVVCLTISSKISGTYQIAVSAAEAVKSTIDVRVVDTQGATLAEGIVCREAARLADTGASADDIVTAIEDFRSKVHLYGALDTLDNLKKGGRIGAAGAFFGSLLSVKPIVGLVNGEVKPIARSRTRSKALDHLAQLVIDHGAPKNLIVGHSNAPDVEEFLTRIDSVIDRSTVTVALIGSVVGTHAGPRLMAVSFTD